MTSNARTTKRCSGPNAALVALVNRITPGTFRDAFRFGCGYCTRARYRKLYFYPTRSGKETRPTGSFASSYGRLVLDVLTGVLTLNAVPHDIADYVRCGGHIFGGIWIVTASLSGSRPMQIVGVILGGLLFTYTLVSPFLPMEVLAPNALFFLVWLGIIAWQNGSKRVQQAL